MFLGEPTASCGAPSTRHQATRNNGIFTFNGREEIVSPEQLNPAIDDGDDINNAIAETDPDLAMTDQVIEP